MRREAARAAAEARGRPLTEREAGALVPVACVCDILARYIERACPGLDPRRELRFCADLAADLRAEGLLGPPEGPGR